MSIKRAPSVNSNTSWSFANTQLTEIEKVECIKWYGSKKDDIYELLFSVVDAGYKFSLKLDVDREIYYASLSGNKNTFANQGVTLSSRHPEASVAIGITLYKHLIISDSDIWRDDEDRIEWG